MSNYKPPLRKKTYQFTVRVPDKLKQAVLKRLQRLGFNTIAEYARHLIINDINGQDGEYYGQETIS